MIRIRRPATPPLILRTRGAAETSRNLAQLNQSRAAFLAGSRTFTFDSSIYAAPEVKHALLLMQRGKCCFCESRIEHISFGDVEHFRPKGGFTQRQGDPLGRPGYYWLSYEWTNLLLCCQLCNQRHKRNLFPLRNPRRRAITHSDDLALERPLFVDPVADDPSRYIGFREEFAIPVGAERRGRVTIDALGLNREPLALQRREHLAKLKLLRKCRDVFARQVADHRASRRTRVLLREIESELKRCRQDGAEYASMSRAAISD